MRIPARAPLALAALALGCSEAPTAPPADPGTPPAAPAVASVTVTTPVGPLLTIGASAQLTATAVDAAGDTVSTSFIWSVTDPEVASVSSTGRLVTLGPGETGVRAEVDGVSGSVELTVVDLDSEALESLLADPLVDQLLAALDPATGDVLRPLWARCRESLAQGDVTALSTCLDDAGIRLAEGETAGSPLAAILSLFVRSADRLLDRP